jgi:UDP-N-acetyl-D-mannosaminuronic acid dehydrogenase
VVEPNIEELPSKLADKLALNNVEQALAEADVIVLLVDHKEFKGIAKTILVSHKVVDTRGVWAV